MRAIWYISTWREQVNPRTVAAKIDAGELKKHHTATAAGYISRRPGGVRAYAYAGKFGRGFVVCSPRFDTTKYFNVTYYIETGAKL